MLSDVEDLQGLC